MTGFCYHLVVEPSTCLCIQIEDGGRRRPLYREDFIRIQRDKDLLAALMRQEYSFRKKTLYTAEVIALHKIHIQEEAVSSLLPLLGATGRLFFEGKRVIVDPFKKISYRYDIVSLEDGSWRATGHIEGGFALIIKTDPPWVLQDGVLRPLNIKKRWLLEEPKQIPASIQEKFTDQLEMEGAPLVRWDIAPLAPILPFPCLQLKDRFGACADLWMEYEGKGRVKIEDIEKVAWRNREEEKSWEKDLLETGFISLVMEGSRYFCPMHLVAKSLTFLLEIGWKVIDHQGRALVLQTKQDLFCEEMSDALALRGQIHYGSYKADVEKVMGAFNKNERFIELSSGHVGLIDAASCEDIGQIRIKKSHFALLEGVLAKDKWERTCGTWTEKKRAEPGSCFCGTLHLYQQEGVDWLDWLFRSGFSGLLADAMGLGKTVQVLAFLSRIDPESRVLIVAPTSLLFNWHAEIARFLPQGFPGLTLTSYALLRRDYLLLQQTDFTAIFLDEAQYIKNAQAQVAKCACSLRARMRVAISGTPIENRWEELWSIFAFLCPELLGDKKSFQAEMLAAQQDSRYLKRIQKKIAPFILRRSKERIADQLPEKCEQLMWVEMSTEQRSCYESLLAHRRKDLLSKISKEGLQAHRMEVLELILRLRQISCDPRLVDANCGMGGKLEQLLIDIESLEGKKALIYSQFTEMLKLIASAFKEKGWNFVYLDGSSKNREESVRAFQEDPDTTLFLISLKAGGVGLNLTAADYVFLFDPWWNDAVEAQAIDRAHRLGRKHTVIARRYLTPLSIEEKLQQLKVRKSALAAGLIGDELVPHDITEEDIWHLLADL